MKKRQPLPKTTTEDNTSCLDDADKEICNYDINILDVHEQKAVVGRSQLMKQAIVFMESQQRISLISSYEQWKKMVSSRKIASHELKKENFCRSKRPGLRIMTTIIKIWLLCSLQSKRYNLLHFLHNTIKLHVFINFYDLEEQAEMKEKYCPRNS